MKSVLPFSASISAQGMGSATEDGASVTKATMALIVPT